MREPEETADQMRLVPATRTLATRRSWTSRSRTWYSRPHNLAAFEIVQIGSAASKKLSSTISGLPVL